MKPEGVMTIDFEDWRSALVMQTETGHDEESEADLEFLVHSTRILLNDLERYEARATFFVIGEVAARVPELIRLISRSGHEIASHSPFHKPIKVTPRKELISLIEQDVRIIHGITGKQPVGFRAPYFSVTRQDGWLLRELSRIGFAYDSSVVPSWTPLYGIPSAPKHPYFPKYDDIAMPGQSGGILEIPVNVWPNAKLIPGLIIGGGFFLRVWPLRLSILALRSALRREISPVVYIHPSDIVPHPRIGHSLSFRDRIIQNSGTDRGLVNFRGFLKELKWGTMGELCSSILQCKDAPRDGDAVTH